jgi:hypothetical protein
MHAAFEAQGGCAKAWPLGVDLTGARAEAPGQVPAPGLELYFNNITTPLALQEGRFVQLDK